ncbi:MAG: hypothetical protein IKL07_07315 [Clostridium sp.]|nr:hypothetical protein [Clostridium sp.]
MADMEMEEKKTYAEQIMQKVKEQQNQDGIDYVNPENHIEDGFIIIKYAKLELEEKQIGDSGLRMVLPKSYSIMDEALAKKKYPDDDRPAYIYTSEDSTVNFTYSIEEGIVEENEIPELKNLILKEMKRLHPASEVEQDELIETKGGKHCAVFGMEIPILDGSVYNASFFYAVSNGLLIGSFNCDASDKKQWKPVLIEMLSTLEE